MQQCASPRPGVDRQARLLPPPRTAAPPQPVPGAAAGHDLPAKPAIDRASAALCYSSASARGRNAKTGEADGIERLRRASSVSRGIVLRIVPLAPRTRRRDCGRGRDDNARGEARDARLCRRSHHPARSARLFCRDQIRAAARGNCAAHPPKVCGKPPPRVQPARSCRARPRCRGFASQAARLRVFIARNRDLGRGAVAERGQISLRH